MNWNRVYCVTCETYYPKDLCGRNGMGQATCPEGHRARTRPTTRRNRPRVDGRQMSNRITVQEAVGPVVPEGWEIVSHYTPIPIAVLMAYFERGW